MTSNLRKKIFSTFGAQIPSQLPILLLSTTSPYHPPPCRFKETTGKEWYFLEVCVEYFGFYHPFLRGRNSIAKSECLIIRGFILAVFTLLAPGCLLNIFRWFKAILSSSEEGSSMMPFTLIAEPQRLALLSWQTEPRPLEELTDGFRQGRWS